MGLFGKLMGSDAYEPGGAHYVRITDEAFKKAKELFLNLNENDRKEYSKQAAELTLTQYEAHDFPVSEILGVFQGAHYLQEEKNGVAEELRIGNIQSGRKDKVDFDNYLKKWKDKLPGNEKGFVRGVFREANEGSLGMSIATGILGGITKGIKSVATGKSEEVRLFEKIYANYICGNSPKAKEYLLGFARKFGGLDEGVCGVAEVIMCQSWLCEIAKSNRGK